MVLQPQDMPLKAGLKVLGDSVSETGVCRWGEGLLEKVPAAGVSTDGDVPSQRTCTHTHTLTHTHTHSHSHTPNTEKNICQDDRILKNCRKEQHSQ